LKSPAVIVVAYNRPHSMLRLLESIQAANYDGHKPRLIFCIDYHKSQSVLEIAEKFEWVHGKKEIIHQDTHLGLVSHMHSAMALSLKHEEVIILEDDLIVSPYYYQYALEALKYYGNEPRIAGVSLYGYGISESSLLSFTPIDNGTDVYFLQFPSSWGFCMGKDQYAAYKMSLNKKELENSKNDPAFIRQWSKHSWKKLFVRFMMKHDKLFVYPRLSLTTNFADKGRHTPVNMSLFQVPVQLQARNYVFAHPSNNISTYDAYFEMVPEAFKQICPLLRHYSFEIDLQGVKDLRGVKLLYTLTTKKSKKHIMAFDTAMNPLLNNMVFGIKGRKIAFSLISNLYRLKPMNLHFGHAEFLSRFSKVLPKGIKSIKYVSYLVKYYLLMLFKRITA